MRDPGTARDRRNLICDIVCVAIITPLTVATAYMCINGAMKYYREDQWERRGLFSLAAILMSIYILWFVVSTINIGLDKQKTKNFRVKLVLFSYP